MKNWLFATFLLFPLVLFAKPTPMKFKNLSSATQLSIRNLDRAAAEVIDSQPGMRSIEFEGENRRAFNQMEVRRDDFGNWRIICNPHADFLMQPQLYRQLLKQLIRVRLDLTDSPQDADLPNWLVHGIRENARAHYHATRFLKNNSFYPLISALLVENALPDLSVAVADGNAEFFLERRELAAEISRLLVLSVVRSGRVDKLADCWLKPHKTPKADLDRLIGDLLAESPLLSGKVPAPFWRGLLWNRFNPPPPEISFRVLEQSLVLSVYR